MLSKQEIDSIREEAENEKVKCPVCRGTGKFELPHRMAIDKMELQKYLATELRKKGYSIRQIQVALGYKSPRSIQILLK